ncbi:MAG: sporulation peptidase YabG [Bacillota bacterium]|jgi:spore coat assembly protein
MAEIKIGDVVGRKSYNMDVMFKVMDIYSNDRGKMMAHLKGLDYRLCATAPLEDLQKYESGDISKYWQTLMKKNSEQMKRIFSRRSRERMRDLVRAANIDNGEQMPSFDVPGKVLHIDGDKDYLDLCLTTYKQLGVPVEGYFINEKEQPGRVVELLKKHRPDLLVITGHDGFIKERGNDFRNIENYHNSKNFVKAVKCARQYEKSRDDLIIFAGACQSHYESILEAGSNFASSPKRVLIHAFDPLFVMEKIAFTSIYDPLPLIEIIEGTITGFDGIGGVETCGKHRLGVPKSPY